ncbi:MAG: hypothetical protein IJQ13_04645 [Prevotella sp.]|nr:hypothetical protein [Prevotella sp.]
MANKKVFISECCVVTKDDKGQLSMVGKAKEALTTMSKNNIDVTILLEDTDKEALEKFLKDNSVPFKETKPWEEMKKDDKYDALVLGSNNIVLYRNDWDWTVDDIVTKLYRNDEKPPHKSEQQKMDDRFKDYKHWAEEANKVKKKSERNVIAG